MYKIDIRRDIGLLDIAFTGLMTVPVAERYVEDVETAFARSGLTPGYLLRMDFGVHAAQPATVATLVNHRLKHFPRARRIAAVAPSAIAKLQVRRLMPQPYLSVFDDANAAFAWLTAIDH